MTCRGLFAGEISYLRDAVIMSHHLDDIVKWQQGVAFDLGVDVLALSAGSQQLHQVVVVGQSTVLITTLCVQAHQLQQRGERRPVIVEH